VTIVSQHCCDDGSNVSSDTVHIIIHVYKGMSSMIPEKFEPWVGIHYQHTDHASILTGPIDHCRFFWSKLIEVDLFYTACVTLDNFYF